MKAAIVSALAAGALVMPAVASANPGYGPEFQCTGQTSLVVLFWPDGHSGRGAPTKLTFDPSGDAADLDAFRAEVVAGPHASVWVPGARYANSNLRVLAGKPGWYNDFNKCPGKRPQHFASNVIHKVTRARATAIRCTFRRPAFVNITASRPIELDQPWTDARLVGHEKNGPMLFKAVLGEKTMADSVLTYDRNACQRIPLP